MKTTARVIVTYNCNRNCPGCCNEHGNAVYKTDVINELLMYKELIITGGEPVLISEKVMDFISRLRELGYIGKIFLYTAAFDGYNLYHHAVLKQVDGITFTIHAEATDRDIISLKALSKQSILDKSNYSSRLIIDNRVYDHYDFSNIDLKKWDVIRKLQWKDECKPAENEILTEFLL